METGETELRERLTAILRATPLVGVLTVARRLCLPDWLVFSGAIYQPVLNHLTGRPLDYGIKDYDLAYFDASDLSYEAEDAIIRRVTTVFDEPVRSMVQVRNQARVRLWFEAKFGEPYTPLSCTAEALERFASATFAVGVRLGCTLRLPLVSLIYLPCACGLTPVGRRFISPEPLRMYDAAGPKWSLKMGHRLSLSHRSRPNSDSLRAPDHRSESPSTTALVKFRRANPVDKEMIQRISADSYIPPTWLYSARSQNQPRRLRAAH